MSVTFSYADRTPTIKAIKALKQFIGRLFTLEQQQLESLSFVFCSDDYLLNINQQFLQHDFFTDIISFDLGASASEAITGEIYISVDRVKENASSLEIPFKEELLRVIFHGALHLCGYKDKKKSEIALMRRKEDEYLRLYNETSKCST